MGKFSLLVVLGAVLGGAIMMQQTSGTSVLSTRNHADRQEEMLAREIARSAYNDLLWEAREFERAHPSKTVAEIIEGVNGVYGKDGKTGAYQGGTYAVKLVPASASSYGVESKGHYGSAEHGVEAPQLRKGTLVVTSPSTFKATFLESQAGYCSAVYLQRSVPKAMLNGADNLDGLAVVSTTPNGLYATLEPELIFASGKDRNGADANYETLLQPGTQLNFILGVDGSDCKGKGKKMKVTDSEYMYYHPALLDGADDLGEMHEGRFAMIEQHPEHPEKYRIAFEDLIKFSDAQHADVKANSYGKEKWEKQANGTYSYGGTGWDKRDKWGYYKLKDTSKVPDFSDQVFEIQLIAAKVSV